MATGWPSRLHNGSVCGYTGVRYVGNRVEVSLDRNVAVGAERGCPSSRRSVWPGRAREGEGTGHGRVDEGRVAVLAMEAGTVAATEAERSR